MPVPASFSPYVQNTIKQNDMPENVAFWLNGVSRTTEFIIIRTGLTGRQFAFYYASTTTAPVIYDLSVLSGYDLITVPSTLV